MPARPSVDACFPKCPETSAEVQRKVCGSIADKPPSPFGQIHLLDESTCSQPSSKRQLQLRRNSCCYQASRNSTKLISARMIRSEIWYKNLATRRLIIAGCGVDRTKMPYEPYTIGRAPLNYVKTLVAVPTLPRATFLTRKNDRHRSNHISMPFSWLLSASALPETPATSCAANMQALTKQAALAMRRGDEASPHCHCKNK